MPRSLTITVPAARTDALVNALQNQPGLLGLAVLRGASVQPPGDIVTVDLLNKHYAGFSRLLDEQRIGGDGQSAYRSSDPIGMASPQAEEIVSDTSESSWEDVELTLTKEAHLTPDMGFLMFVAGFTAAAGIATGALHVVIGAMVIAPGFEPFVRMALGLVTRSRAWRRGLIGFAAGYGLLLLGAACAALLLSAIGVELLSGQSAYHATEPLVTYWTTLSVPAVVVSSIAALAGAVLVATHRSVLTAGVMILLALVPAATLMPVALIAGDLERFGGAVTRWVVEVLLVLAGSLVVLGWKRRRDQRPRMML